MQPAMRVIAMLSALAASSLISAIWEGMVLAACVTLCLHLLPETTAAIRSFVWTAVLLLVVMLHFAANSMKSPAVLGSPHEFAVHLNFRWSIVIASVWVLFSIVRGSQLVMSAIRLHRIATKATPVNGGLACTAILRNAHRSADLCISSDVDSPSVIGFASPRILIPAALFEKLSVLELEQIVVHEMEHLRRGDDWINLLQKIILVLFPLNPVLRWVERHLCLERELACDDGVLRFTKAPKTYANCLANLAEHSMLHREASLALRAWERQSELVSRVHRILQRTNLGMGRRQTKVVAGVLVLGLLGGTAALSHCPRLVSFSSSSVSVNVAAAPQTLAPPSFQEVVFHPGSAHAMAINAVMPERPDIKKLVTKQPHHHKSRIRYGNGRRAVMSSWVLVTYWNQVPSASYLEFTVIENFRSSYPAALRNSGWVVVQL